MKSLNASNFKPQVDAIGVLRFDMTHLLELEKLLAPVFSAGAAYDVLFLKTREIY